MSSGMSSEDEQRTLLSELAVVEALDAALFARRMRLRAEMDAAWNPADGEFAQEQFGVLELAGTARIGQTRASSQLIDGTRLVQELPGTLAALQAGTMYRETAVLLLQLTRNCSAEVTRELERRLLPTILTANTTDVRRLVLKLIPEIEADLDPELTEQRLDHARADRGVWQHDRGQGMVGITGEMDVISARRWSLDFEELVRAQKLADDRAGTARTAAQRRADVFAQLPSRFLALLRAIQRGEVSQLRAIAQADPDLADGLEALAATLPLKPNDTSPAPKAEDRPPDPPDPLDEQSHWTELGWLELAATLLGQPIKNPMVLNVHIPMSTLLERDHRTGTVEGAGGGALPAAHARVLLPSAELRRVFVDPDSGVPIGLDPTIIRASRAAPAAPAAPAATASSNPRLDELLTPFVLRDLAQPQHDPSRRLRRFIELRDQHCTGIGCSQPAARCHLDHETAYPAGPTAAWNLGAKSARCHRAKHAGWTVTRHGPGTQHGQTTWTSPLGHHYTRLSAWHHVPAGTSSTSSRDGDTPIIEIERAA